MNLCIQLYIHLFYHGDLIYLYDFIHLFFYLYIFVFNHLVDLLIDLLK